MLVAILLYLCDSGAVENLPAVDPSVDARDALRPVAMQLCVRGEAGGVREAEVHGDSLIPVTRVGVFPAPVWRRGSGEDAHHHVEGEEDLRQTNPYVQNLLVLAETSDGSEDLVEIHYLKGGLKSGCFRAVKRRRREGDCKPARLMSLRR